MGEKGARKKEEGHAAGIPGRRERGVHGRCPSLPDLVDTHANLTLP